MARKYNFADYRTYEAIEHAMFWYADAVTTSVGLRGTCPSKQCENSKRKTLVCAGGAPVAYCHRCQKTFDALSLTTLAERVDLYTACEKLNHVIG